MCDKENKLPFSCYNWIQSDRYTASIRGQAIMRFIKKEGKDQENTRYNQAPHLTQDTNGKVTTSQ